MATTLSYGYIKPQDGDKGSTWFPALESNFQRTNDHTHNGIDSAPLPATSVVKGTVSIPSGSWTADGTGRYRQDVTVPAGYNMDDYTLTIRLASTGHQIYPSVEKLTSTTFRVFGPDNTLTYTAVFR